MRYIKELEGLRGIMALWVVLGHALAALPLISPRIPAAILNSYAVDVFIILSGFVIFFMINNKKQSYGVYLTQRFFRLFPVYLFALFASMLLIDFSHDVLLSSPVAPATERRIELIEVFLQQPFWHTLVHLPLLQGIVPSFVLHDASYTIIGQAWSVSVEWQFYLIAPFLFFLLNNIVQFSNQIKLLLICSLLVVSGLMLTGGYVGNNLMAFAIGFASFYYYRDVQPKISQNVSRAIFIIAIILSVLLLKKNAIPVIIWLVAFNIAISKQQYAGSSIFTKILDSRPMLFLGRISYSLYMVHMIALYFSLYLANYFDISSSLVYLFVPALTIVISICVSFVTYSLIEKPCIVLGKKFTEGKKQEVNSALR